MAISRFYTGKSDTNITKDHLLNSGDVYIQVEEFSGTATLDTTVSGSNTLTFTKVGVSADDYNSVGENLEIVDDNGKVATVAIDDTTATSNTVTITFDEASLLLAEDGVTPASLTDTSTYSIKVWTPTSAQDGGSGAYGKYLGVQTSISIATTDEYADLNDGVPQTRVNRGLVSRVMSVTGSNSQVCNKDILELVFGAVEYGSQTDQYSIAIGFNPGEQKNARLIIVYTDKGGRTTVNRFLLGTFSVTGEQELTSTEFKMIEWAFELTRHPFYPDNADARIVKRAS